jgi:hypothetical protein
MLWLVRYQVLEAVDDVCRARVVWFVEILVSIFHKRCKDQIMTREGLL